MRLIPVAVLVTLTTACATTSGSSTRSEDLAPLQPVLFSSGAGALATPADYMRVGQAAQRLQQDDEAVLLVAGYSDASGDANTNQRISQQRAELVKQLLVDAGVPSEKIVAVGLGELPDTGNAAGDRRVEFVFSSSSDGVASQDELLDVLSEARDAGEEALADADDDDRGGDDEERSSSKKSKKSKGDEGPDRTPMETIGLSDLDSFFARVQDLRDILWNTTDALDEARSGLNDALGLAADVAATDAVERLKELAAGSVSVAMSGGKPQLKPTGAVPAEVSRGIDAANKLVSACTRAATNLAQLPGKAQALVAEAKALPAKVPTMAKDAGMSLGEIGQATKAVKTNVGLTVKFPDELTDTIDSAKELVELVKSFAG